MARKTKDEVYQIKKEIADLLYNHKDEIKFINGQPSPTHLMKLLKERGYDVSRQSIAKFLDDGVEKYRQALILEDNQKVRDIKEAMRVQKEIWNSVSNKPSDRTKAANSWRSLHKQLMEYEQQIVEARLKTAEVSKPNFLIKIEPPNVLKTCPKCGHEWYDIEDHKKEKKLKVTKECDEQKQFDDFEDEKNGN